VRVAFLPLSEGEIEILQSTKPDGPVAKFIEARGEGVQHIALRVDDLEAALAELKEKGVRLIDEQPRKGAGGARIAFVHPKRPMGCCWSSASGGENNRLRLREEPRPSPLPKPWPSSVPQSQP